jgi:hypothetical protein
MTDRINGFWVALENDVRVDDAEAILAAVRCLKGVIAVEANVTGHADWIATARVRRELVAKLYEALK